MKRSENQKQWERRLSERITSGLSKARFCRDNGLSLASFDYWERKLRAPSIAGETTPATRFARAEFEPPPNRTELLIRFAYGVVVESTCGYPDPSWITSVARALRECAL